MKGIHLISDTKTGRRYVGSAYSDLLATYAAGGWNRRPAVKQARHGLAAIAKCSDAGLM